VAGMLDRETPGGGYLHTPSWLGKWWFEELTAEQRDLATGKWVRTGKRPNEAFDLLAYALAVHIIIGAEKINWQKPPVWAHDWDGDNPLIHDPDRPKEQTQMPAKARRPRRVVKSNLL